MNGKMVANKPLYVGLAQRKEERRAMLMVCQFVHAWSAFSASHVCELTLFSFCTIPRRKSLTLTSFFCKAHFAHVNQTMTGVPYAGVYFGYPVPGQIPPQTAVFGFQQAFVPGMRPGSVMMPPNNVHRSRHPGQRTGFRQQQQQVCVVWSIH